MKNSRFLSALYIFICIIAISCSNLVQNLRDAVPVSQINYTVTLYAGTRGSFTGETYKTVTVPENTQLDLNLYKPDIPAESQEKWQFNQWLDETGSTIDKPVRITGDCAFLAEYIKLCTVTFKNDNVTVRTIKGIRQNTYIKEPPKLEKDGYEFVGWFTDNDIQWNFTDNAVIQDMTLDAHWTQIQHTITFISGEHGSFADNKKEDSISIPHGQNIDFTSSQIPVPQPNEEKWRFLYWVDEETKLRIPIDSYPVTKDATLIAKWTANEYAVSFAAGTQGYFVKGSEKLPSSEITVQHGESINLLDSKYLPVQYTGWKFNGWLLEGKLISNAENYEVKKNIKLTASYRRLNLHIYNNNESAAFIELGKTESSRLSFAFEEAVSGEYNLDANGIVWTFPDGSENCFSAKINQDKHSVELTGKTPTTQNNPVIVSVTINGIESAPLAVSVGDYYAVASFDQLNAILQTLPAGTNTIKIKNSEFNTDTQSFETLITLLGKETDKTFVIDLSEAENLTLSGSMFSGNTNIQNIILPDTLDNIPKGTFYGFRALQTVSLPAGLKTIGASAFAFSTITQISLPSTLKVIEGFAFYGCEYLKEITIPASVVSIGDLAFTDTAIKQVVFYGNPANCTLGTSVFPDDAIIYVADPGSIPVNSPWRAYTIKRISEL